MPAPKKVNFWPIEIEDSGRWPKDEKGQVRLVKIYNVYMSIYEKTYSTEAAKEHLKKKFKYSDEVIKTALSFSRAIIKEMNK